MYFPKVEEFRVPCDELQSESFIGCVGQSYNCKPTLTTERHANMIAITIHWRKCYTKYEQLPKTIL